MSKQVATVRNWRKVVVAFVLTAALIGLPVLAEIAPGPLSSFFVQHAYACPVGGSCG